MQCPRHYFNLKALIGILTLSMAALMVHGQQPTLTDASKSAYDFDSLSGVIDADQVDYFSGNGSYVLPLGEVEAAQAVPTTPRADSPKSRRTPTAMRTPKSSTTTPTTTSATCASRRLPSTI